MALVALQGPVLGHLTLAAAAIQIKSSGNGQRKAGMCEVCVERGRLWTSPGAQRGAEASGTGLGAAAGGAKWDRAEFCLIG